MQDLVDIVHNLDPLLGTATIDLMLGGGLMEDVPAGATYTFITHAHSHCCFYNDVSVKSTSSPGTTDYCYEIDRAQPMVTDFSPAQKDGGTCAVAVSDE